MGNKVSSLLFLEPPSFKCSKEYFQYDESCYKFVNSPKTFDQARDACRKESAELISVETEFEQGMRPYRATKICNICKIFLFDYMLHYILIYLEAIFFKSSHKRPLILML